MIIIVIPINWSSICCLWCCCCGGCTAGWRWWWSWRGDHKPTHIQLHLVWIHSQACTFMQQELCISSHLRANTYSNSNLLKSSHKISNTIWIWYIASCCCCGWVYLTVYVCVCVCLCAEWLCEEINKVLLLSVNCVCVCVQCVNLRLLFWVILSLFFNLYSPNSTTPGSSHQTSLSKDLHQFHMRIIPSQESL